MTNIAIIGAGLAGLTAAHHLKQYANITLFEKARGVSGRMSTRRAEPYFFDHGAQYFTARTPEFQNFIEPLINQGIIKRWNARYAKFDGNQIIERRDWGKEEPRYVGTPAMNAIARMLAEPLDVHINTRIAQITRKDKWVLTDEAGEPYGEFDWVLVTIPAPQVCDLLPASFSHYGVIKEIEMRACFSLMLGFQKPLQLSFDAAHIEHSDLSWIAINSSKPDRGKEFTLMVHASNIYAEAHINDDREQVMRHLLAETSNIIGHDVSDADYKTIHGWRYANNAPNNNKGGKQSPIFIDQNQQLATCGDWCQGGRVEGAFMAAYNLANTLKACL